MSLKTHERYYVRWANSIARVAREAPIVPRRTDGGKMWEAAGGRCILLAVHSNIGVSKLKTLSESAELVGENLDQDLGHKN